MIRLSMMLRFLVLTQFASTLSGAGGLRGTRITRSDASHVNTPIHRSLFSENVELDHVTVTSDPEEIAPESMVLGQQMRDFLGDVDEKKGLEKLIVGGGDAGVDSDDYNYSVQPKPKPKPRLIGAKDVQESERFPWFVRMLGLDDQNRISACGASLVAPDIVITAAHCDDPDRVMVGPYDLREIWSGNEGSMIRRDVVDFRRHPDWADGQQMTIDNDVMLIKLEKTVQSIAPIRLNFDDNFPAKSGEELLMLGFGSVIGGPETGLPNGPNQQAEILKEAPTDYVAFEECAVAEDPDTGVSYGLGPKRTNVKDFWLCTLRAGTGSCYGDSGGPVIKEGTTAEYDLQVGVISGASGYCGNPYLPLWNNRVSAHQDWIKSVGCELSTKPPAYWCCPGEKCEEITAEDFMSGAGQKDVIDIDIDTDTSAGGDADVDADADADKEEFEIPLELAIGVGAGVAGVLAVASIGYFIYKRRKNRIDDIDHHSTKNDKKPSKSDRKPNNKSDDEEQPPSPATSTDSDGDLLDSQGDVGDEEKGNKKGRFPFFSKLSNDESPKEETLVDFDPESQQTTEDTPLQITDESSKNEKRGRYFPSLFKGKAKPPEESPESDVEEAQDETEDDPPEVTEEAPEIKKGRGFFPSLFKGKTKSTEESPESDVEEAQDETEDVPPQVTEEAPKIKKGRGFFPSLFKGKTKPTEESPESDSEDVQDAPPEDAPLQNTEEESNKRQNRRTFPSLFRGKTKPTEESPESDGEDVQDAPPEDAPLQNTEEESNKRQNRRTFPSLFRGKTKPTEESPESDAEESQDESYCTFVEVSEVEAEDERDSNEKSIDELPENIAEASQDESYCTLSVKSKDEVDNDGYSSRRLFKSRENLNHEREKSLKEGTDFDAKGGQDTSLRGAPDNNAQGFNEESQQTPGNTPAEAPTKRGFFSWMFKPREKSKSETPEGNEASLAEVPAFIEPNQEIPRVNSSDDLSSELSPSQSPTRDAVDSTKDVHNTIRRKRIFPSLFRANRKSSKDDLDNAVSESSVAQASKNILDTKETRNFDTKNPENIPRDMEIQNDCKYNEFDSHRAMTQPIQNEGTGSIMGDKLKSDPLNFDSGYTVDDDIKAIVNRGRDRSPFRTRSLDRSDATEYAKQRSDRIRSRSLSGDRSKANDFASKKENTNQPRGRSKERSRASEFTSDKNKYGRSMSSSRDSPFASEFGLENTSIRSRSVSRDGPLTTEFTSEKKRNRTSRSLSLEREGANQFASKEHKASRTENRNETEGNRSRGRSRGRSEANAYASKEISIPRSRSLEHSKANNFASKHTRNPRRRSKERTQAKAFASKESSSPRSRSRERSEANKYASRGNGQSRTRSKERSEATRFANEFASERHKPRSKSLQRNNDPIGTKFSNPNRSSSLDRSHANDLANRARVREPRNRSRERSEASLFSSDKNRSQSRTPQRKSDPSGIKYIHRKRSSSMDQSRARNFAESGQYRQSRSRSRERSDATKFSSEKNKSRSKSLQRSNIPSSENYARNKKRSLSLDRSNARKFANRIPRSSQRESSMLPSQRQSNISPKSKQVPPIRTSVGKGIVQNGSRPAGVTKNPDGSVVVTVKRRRADGALVTTKTKYANVKLARKHGVAV